MRTSDPFDTHRRLMLAACSVFLFQAFATPTATAQRRGRNSLAVVASPTPGPAVAKVTIVAFKDFQ